MSNFLKKLKKEVIDAIPAIIYFCIAFNLINFTEGLYFSEGYLRVYSYTTVTLAALVMGKILIICNNFPFINAFPNKPLIYNIVWKFFIYSSAVLLMRILEDYLHLIFRYDNGESALQLLITQLSLPPFWGTQLWLTLVFLIFVIFNEFAIYFGKDRIKQILFGTKK